MDWKDIGSGILNFAPTIAKALGVPGFIADGAAGVLKSVLGLGSDATEQDVQAELAKLAPADYVKLREADMAYKQHILDAGVKLEELGFQDRDSARKNQAATQSKTPDILAGVLTIGFFGLLVLMCFKAPPSESKDLLNIMLGALGAAWTTAMAFFFGSSQGSDKLKNILSAGGK